MGTELADSYDRIAEAYDLGRVLDAADEPARGLQGQVWRLRTATGTWAVKETFGEIAESEAAHAGDFQETARRAGVPAPAVCRTGDGRHLIFVDGRSIRVHGWVDVAEPDTALGPAQVGATLARLHRVVLPAVGPAHWWYTEPVGAATWDQFVDASQAAGAPFTERLAALRDELVALEMAMTPMEPVQLCHLDLWADNVRRTAQGGLCILDWDNCGPADPGRELALVLFEFGRQDPARIADLHEAYRSAGGSGRLHEPADFSMLAAQLGHIAAMHLRRWLDPESSEPARQRALIGIEEFVDGPLTPAVVRTILDAID
jgi:Ser/Thr protein kinase RdoA (MazF antagonist)